MLLSHETRQPTHKNLILLVLSQLGVDQAEWEFVCLLPLFDPPRHDTKETIERCREKGIDVKMVTGDQLLIGKETSRQLGMGTNLYSTEALLEVRLLLSLPFPSFPYYLRQLGFGTDMYSTKALLEVGHHRDIPFFPLKTTLFLPVCRLSSVTTPSLPIKSPAPLDQASDSPSYTLCPDSDRACMLT
jgi:hypothetical protein